MATYYTRGIVLRQRDFREADRLVTIYTEEYGKMTVLARGARKITSKLSASLQPFTLADFMIAGGKLFDTVAASEVAAIFRRLKASPEKIYLADYLAEVVISSTKDRHRDRRIFELLSETLDWLDGSQTAGRDAGKMALVWHFVWRHIFLLGYQPEFYRCLACGRKIEPKKNYFSFRKGGLVCQSCASSDKEAVFISNDCVKILRLASLGRRQTLEKISVSRGLAKELNRFSGDFLSYIQEKNMTPDRFLFPR